MPVLETARLILRAPEPEDVAPIIAMHGDRDVMRYLASDGEPDPSPGSAYDYLLRQIGHWYVHGCGKWMVIERASGAVIGRVGYLNPPHEWPGLELGWTLARSAWGKGYATEAALVCRDWAFSAFGGEEIVSLIRVGNDASVRVAERIGEQHLRRETVREQICDIYGMSKAAWRVLKA